MTPSRDAQSQILSNPSTLREGSLDQRAVEPNQLGQDLHYPALTELRESEAFFKMASSRGFDDALR
jgi:hypothetical protein